MAMNSFERRIERAKDDLSNTELAKELGDVYSWYLSHAKKKKFPREAILSIYEREIDDLKGHPSSIWIDYYQYCLGEEGFSGYEMLQNILNRALEHHPMKVHLWILQVELIELRSRLAFEPSVISDVITKLSVIHAASESFVALLTIYDAIGDLLIRMLNKKLLSLDMAMWHIDMMIEIKEHKRASSFEGYVHPISKEIPFPYVDDRLMSAHSPSFYRLERRKTWLHLITRGEEEGLSSSANTIIRALFEDQILKCKRELKCLDTWLEYVAMER